MTEWVIVRRLHDLDDEWKWFTFYPNEKGGKPSNVFHSREKAEAKRQHWIHFYGDSSPNLKVVPYRGKTSKDYIYLDRWG